MLVNEFIDAMPFITSGKILKHKDFQDVFIDDTLDDFIEIINEDYPNQIFSHDGKFLIVGGTEIEIKPLLELIDVKNLKEDIDLSALFTVITDPLTNEFIVDKVNEIVNHFLQKFTCKMDKIKERLKKKELEKYQPQKFTRIVTRSDLQRYVRMVLGEPIIKVELTDEQISQMINDAIQKFTGFAYGTLERGSIMKLQGKGDYKLPNLVRSIKGFSTMGSGMGANSFGDFGGYVPDVWTYSLFSSYGGAPYYSGNAFGNGFGGTGGATLGNSVSGSGLSNILTGYFNISTWNSIREKYLTREINYSYNRQKNILQVLENYNGNALLWYNYDYIPNEEGDLIFNEEWVKDYTVALCRVLWGNNVGKYNQTLVGGASINYSDIRDIGLSSIEKLEEELISKWSAPFMLYAF